MGPGHLSASTFTVAGFSHLTPPDFPVARGAKQHYRSVNAINLAAASFDEWVCVKNHRPSDTPADSWLPAIQLITPETLTRRVDHTHEALLTQRHEGKAGHGHDVPAVDGPVSRRVALSATQLGIVARLVVPVVAARALGHDVDFPRLADLWFRDVLPAPVPVSVAWQPGPAKIAGSAVEEITHAFVAAGLSKIIAWDNLASAVSTSVIMVTRCRPDLRRAAIDAATDMLVLVDPRPGITTGPGFRRRSCCLYYQASGSRIACCGDCVLV